MKMIVDGYVRLKDREALEQLHNHRHRLRQQLRELRGGSLDVLVTPGEGTTMILRLAAATLPSRPETEPQVTAEPMFAADFDHSISRSAA